MIQIKTVDEIKKMRAAGKLAFKLLEMITPHVKPGVSTEKLNNLCHEFTIKNNAISAPLNYQPVGARRPFPKSICTSVNNVVCHGIPSESQILKDGDIVNIDVTVILDGYHGDTSRTYFVGENIAKETKLLVERTKKAMTIGIKAIKPGGFFCDIGNAIDIFIRPFGYGIVRDLGGHGIGSKFHEPPFVHHYRQKKKSGPKFKEGMTFTVEPMINMGENDVYVDSRDHWTVYSSDGSVSAQFEHTVLVTNSGVEILTKG